MNSDLKTEKMFEAFVSRIEDRSDRSTRNCPVLRANVQLLTRLKEDNNRKLMSDLGFISDLDTSKCEDCDMDDLTDL